MLNILIADDHAIVRKGLKQILLEEYPTAIIGEAADAEMLISHGVDPKAKAPNCAECHGTLSGHTPDGTGMVPFTKLGYHTVPAAVKACTQCHSKETMSWSAMHDKHRSKMSCKTCHTTQTIVVR